MMKTKNKKIATLAAMAGLLVAAGTASAAITITDAVATSETNPFVSATLDAGVTVTGTDVYTNLAGIGVVDTIESPWNGNEYTYRNTSASPGSVTYAAASGDYFTDFAAQIIVNRGQIGETEALALARFAFEKSTDGIAFTTIAVSGSRANDPDIGDWFRWDVSTTDLDLLTDITHLRVTMTEKASGGASWHQQIGSVSMDVVPVPEPSSTALLGLGGLALILRRRRD